MTNPFRAHTRFIQAQEAARSGGSGRSTKGYDLMLLQLNEDRRRLKGIQSNVRKAEIKVEVLPKYAAWAEGVLSADGAQQDDVLMYVMLWRVDAGDYAGALAIGRHALKHGWAMPLGSRTTATVLAEEIADAAKAAILAKTLLIRPCCWRRWRWSTHTTCPISHAPVCTSLSAGC